MNRRLLLLLSIFLVLALALAACGAQTSPAEEAAEQD